MRRLERELLTHAVQRFTSLLGCISYGRVTVLPLSSPSEDAGYVIEAAGFQPVPLRSRPTLWLNASQQVHLRNEQQSSGEPHVQEVGYAYRISQGEPGQQELLAYHWDQYSPMSGSTHPHLHIGTSAYRPLNTGRLQDFHKRHIPTGRVTFPMVVRFLIEDLGVEPINPNWERILSGADPV